MKLTVLGCHKIASEHQRGYAERPTSTVWFTGTMNSSGPEMLQATTLLDYHSEPIQHLIDERGWRTLDPDERIGAIYDFVQNEIAFGYNADDNLSASQVLADGIGQCNTKTTLLMALLRAVDIPCRFHAATVHKRLQKGVINGLAYRRAPDTILHSWAEVHHQGEWKRLEGVILDTDYLDGLRCLLGNPTGAHLGHAAGTDQLENPNIAWNGDHTEIQMTGVDRDLGVYNDPDTYYRSAGTNLSGVKSFLYRHLVRRLMNRTVDKIRHTPS